MEPCDLRWHGERGQYGHSSVLDAACTDFCENLHGCIDETHEMGFRKGEIPVPVWIIEDAEAAPMQKSELLTYWRRACGCEASAQQVAPDQWEYRRQTEPPYVSNREKEAYRVCYSLIPNASRNHAKRLLCRIWKTNY